MAKTLQTTKSIITSVMRQISDRDFVLMKNLEKKGFTLQEIAEIFETTKQNVSRILKK